MELGLRACTHIIPSLFSSLRYRAFLQLRRFLVCGGDGTVTWVLHELEASLHGDLEDCLGNSDIGGNQP